MRFYGGKIRSIIGNHAGLTGRHEHIYVDKHTVHCLLSGENPLVPHLTHLDISLMDFDDQAVYPQLLIGRTLRKLYVDYDPDTDQDERDPTPPFSVWSNIACILSKATQLDSLCFSPYIWMDYQSFPNEMHLLLPLLLASNSLMEVAIPADFDLATLQHFASAKSLTQLEFTIPSAVVCQFLSSWSLSAHIFQSLKLLEIETDNLGVVPLLLECNGFGCLQGLSIHCNDPNIPYDLHSIFTSLLHNNQTANIQEVIIDKINPQSTPTPTINRLHSLLPLCEFPNITMVHMDMIESIILDDGVLKAIADKWPGLKKLQLYDWCNPTQPTSSSITLNRMLSLAKCCHLRSLALWVNACGSIPDLSMISYPKDGGKLTSFWLCRSPGLCSNGLTQFLWTLFPNLRNLSYGYDQAHTLFASIENLGVLEQEYFEFCHPLFIA